MMSVTPGVISRTGDPCPRASSTDGAWGQGTSSLRSHSPPFPPKDVRGIKAFGQGSTSLICHRYLSSTKFKRGQKNSLCPKSFILTITGWHRQKQGLVLDLSPPLPRHEGSSCSSEFLTHVATQLTALECFGFFF